MPFTLRGSLTLATLLASLLVAHLVHAQDYGSLDGTSCTVSQALPGSFEALSTNVRPCASAALPGSFEAGLGHPTGF